MRPISRLLFASAVLAAAPQLAPAQPPGGGRDRGGFGGDAGGGGMRMGRGGGMNPDDSFNRLQQSYGGTGDVIDYSRVPPETRDRTNRFLQMAGEPPMPTSGTITRETYRGDFARRMEKMQSQFGGGRGMGGPGGGMGGPPGMMAAPGAAPGGVTMTMSVGGAPPGAGGIPGAPPISDDMYRSMMKRYDRDGDGRISLEEGQQSGSLRDSFASYDKNGDRFLDLEEYKTFATDRMSGRAGPPGGDRGDRGSRGGPPDTSSQPPQYGGGVPPQGGFDPRGSAPAPQKPGEEPADPRLIVYRYGKLPKELPSWFTQLDEDKDGQIGLYEWRRGGEQIIRFTPMDLNGDGFITAEEYFLYRKLKDEGDKVTAIENGETPPRSSSFGSSSDRGGSRFGGSSSRGETTETKSKAEKKEKDTGDRPERTRGKGGNPFTGK